MKFQRILAIAAATGLVVSGSVYAGQAITKNTTKTDTAIHTLQVNNTGSRNIYGNVTASVGRLVGNVCMPKFSEPSQSMPFGAGSQSWLTLNGDVLAHDFGLNYNCGMINLQTDTQNIQDTFFLYNNGVTYTGTSPLYAYAYVN